MTKDGSTAIGVVMDESGSMSHLVNDTIGGFNTFLREQKAIPGEATLTLALFNHDYKLVHDGVSLKDVPELTTFTYKPSGTTALLDAVGRTVDTMGRKFASMKEEDRPSKVVVLIMTDGEENASSDYKHARIKEMVAHQQEKYGWSFAFIGANIDSFAVGSSMGLSKGSTYSYASNSVGTQSLYSSMSAGTTNFRRSKMAANFNMVDPIQVTPITVVPTVVDVTLTPTVVDTANVVKGDSTK